MTVIVIYDTAVNNPHIPVATLETEDETGPILQTLEIDHGAVAVADVVYET